MKRQSACVRPLRKDVCFARSSLTCFKMEKKNVANVRTWCWCLQGRKSQKGKSASVELFNLWSLLSSDIQWHFRHVPLAALKVGLPCLPHLAPTHLFLGPNFLSNYVVTCRNYVKLSLKPGEKSVHEALLCLSRNGCNGLATSPSWTCFRTCLPLSILWYAHYPSLSHFRMRNLSSGNKIK